MGLGYDGDIASVVVGVGVVRGIYWGGGHGIELGL